jgi:hypothetical protein
MELGPQFGAVDPEGDRVPKSITLGKRHVGGGPLEGRVAKKVMKRMSTNFVPDPSINQPRYPMKETRF